MEVVVISVFEEITPLGEMTLCWSQKNASGSGTGANASLDRVTFLQFDISTLDLKTNAELSISTRTSGSNQLFAGETLMLYGISDLNADENVLGATWTWDNSPFIDAAEEGLDGEDNVDESSAIFLHGLTLDADTSGGTSVTFDSADLKAYVEADTNDTLSFIVSLVQPTSTGNTPAFESDSAGAVPFVAPTLTVAAIPETSAIGMMSLAAVASSLIGRRRHTA